MRNALILVCFLLQFYHPSFSQDRDTLRKEFHEILMEDKFFNVFRSDSVICKLLLVNNDSLYLFKALNSNYVISRLYDKNEEYNLIISDTSHYLGYSGDSLFDANFDGYTDYVVNFYSPVGCCPREEKRIYLLQESNKELISPQVILNAYFDQRNKYVLSMAYGYPDPPTGIALSKYVWKKNELVEIESLVKKDESTLILIDSKGNHKEEIQQLPVEYKKIEGIEWFYNK